METKSQSQIVSSVLLILIVVMATTILLSFVVPFVRNQLAAGDCVNVVGKIEIRSNPKYTCFYEKINPSVTTRCLNVQVHFDDVLEYVKGFVITVNSGGSSERFEITSGAKDTRVGIYSNGITFVPSHTILAGLSLPTDNGEKTYSLAASAAPEEINVYPILKNGKVCEGVDPVTVIPNCPA